MTQETIATFKHTARKWANNTDNTMHSDNYDNMFSSVHKNNKQECFQDDGDQPALQE